MCQVPIHMQENIHSMRQALLRSCAAQRAACWQAGTHARASGQEQMQPHHTSHDYCSNSRPRIALFPDTMSHPAH